MNRYRVSRIPCHFLKSVDETDMSENIKASYLMEDLLPKLP